MKNFIFYSLMFVLSITLFSCDKDIYTESEGSNEITSQTVYFEGVGTVEASFVLNEDGKFEFSKDFDSSILDDFFKGTDEPHAFIDENERLHMFKSEDSRMEYLKATRQINQRCSENTSGFVRAKFFKHKNFGSEFTGLRRTRYGSGYFSISNVNSHHSGSNDEISSVSLENTRQKDNYMLTLYKHSNYGGPSVLVTVAKCDALYDVANLKGSWVWFNSWINNWIPQSSFNDTTSSIKGYYYY